MKRTMPLFALAAALFASAAFAQDSTAPAAPEGQTQGQTQTTPKAQRKAAWEAGIKQDCSAEIADGGVCAGKDFSSGLMDCLHKNRKTLSDGCKAAIHHRHHGMKKGSTGATSTPPAAPAAPANPPQQ